MSGLVAVIFLASVHATAACTFGKYSDSNCVHCYQEEDEKAGFLGCMECASGYKRVREVGPMVWRYICVAESAPELATAVSAGPSPKGQNIVELAAATPELSTLVKLLNCAGLGERSRYGLDSAGPFTVFAPTNDAFAKLDQKALQGLLACDYKVLQKLREFLLYHVLDGKFTATELMAVKAARTKEGENVRVSDPDGKVEVNNATVIKANIVASNGIVHIIDTFLQPPSEPPIPNKGDIVQTAERYADLSTLVKALAAGDLVATLEGKGPFTVFAPTNEAFAKIPQDKLTQLLGNKKLLVQLLEYHVLIGKFSILELLHTKRVSTLEKGEVVVREGALDKNFITVNNAYVQCNLNTAPTCPGVDTTNGAVHLVSRVLVPPNFPLALYPENIVEVAESQPDLSTLVQALVAGKLTSTLSGKFSGPFTVFAPTNEAFAKLPAADLKKLLANPKELDSILEYHVLAGKFSIADLKSAHSAKTLEGNTVHVTGSQTVKVNAATVLKADVGASNGVVHIINAVLMPPKTTVVV